MLSDDQLLSKLETLGRFGRRVDVRVILLLIQVEERRLDRRAACPSLYEFCRQKLGMSEGTANRRVVAVRLVRRIPALVQHLQNGTLTLSALSLVKNVLNEANHEDVIAKIAGKSRDQIDELVACMAPKPDVEARLRLLPARPQNEAVPPPPPSVVEPSADEPPRLSPRAEREARGRLAPLAEARWRLQLTADKALHDKIERARTLMRHRNPSGDLTVLIAAAVDALLEKLESPRRKTHATNPRARRTIKPGAIAIATRRAVFARDGEQCTYRDENGQRCRATTLLELDHIESRARGGSGEAENLRVRCHAHNLLHAEEDFGRRHIETKIREHRARRSRAAANVAASEQPRTKGEPRAGP